MNGAVSSVLRAALLGASRNRFLRRNAARHGMRLGASRFVAGQTLDEFVPLARRLNARGLAVAAAILGETCTDAPSAAKAASEYSELLERMAAERLDANVALKLTHLGAVLDRMLATVHLRGLLGLARRWANHITIDMEESSLVDLTLDTYRQLRSEGFDNVGIVLQAYLFRSAGDLKRLLPLAPNVRLVKGAYLEPPSVAFARKADVDANYFELIERALKGDGYTAVATHDETIVARTKALARRLALPLRGRFEFQLLYGIRAELAEGLAAEGYPVRIGAPFGTDWFAYFMRRLAERPENVGFVLRNLR